MIAHWAGLACDELCSLLCVEFSGFHVNFRGVLSELAESAQLKQPNECRTKPARSASNIDVLLWCKGIYFVTVTSSKYDHFGPCLLMSQSLTKPKGKCLSVFSELWTPMIPNQPDSLMMDGKLNYCTSYTADPRSKRFGATQPRCLLRLTNLQEQKSIS